MSSSRKSKYIRFNNGGYITINSRSYGGGYYIRGNVIRGYEFASDGRELRMIVDELSRNNGGIRDDGKRYEGMYMKESLDIINRLVEMKFIRKEIMDEVVYRHGGKISGKKIYNELCEIYEDVMRNNYSITLYLAGGRLFMWEGDVRDEVDSCKSDYIVRGKKMIGEVLRKVGKGEVKRLLEGEAVVVSNYKCNIL